MKFSPSEVEGTWRLVGTKPPAERKVIARVRDKAGTYILPFRVVWDGTDWRNVNTGTAIEVPVVEWKF